MSPRASGRGGRGLSAGALALSLRRIERRPGATADGFPFTVPAIRTLEVLELTRPVTLLVGENGSGKSTFLEALALAAGLPSAGSAELGEDRSFDPLRALADELRLGWGKRTHRGFFLRAEDFLGYARRIAGLRAELEAGLAAVEREYADRPGLARELARTPYLDQLAALERRYGSGLEAGSHGEGFLAFFAERLVPGGLYLLDEPEAPLSPGRQLALIALLRRVEAEGGQAIVATHSPILLAVPGATILSFDRTPVAPVAWDELEHVRLTRDFLADPEAFLRHL